MTAAWSLPAHRRIRCMPPAGGSGVVKQTIPLAYQGLGDKAERLVAELRWSGPIMVEFKTDVASGIPKLMEINGRFWGSLPLAVAAGADFPYLITEWLLVRHCLRTGNIARDSARDIFWGTSET